MFKFDSDEQPLIVVRKHWFVFLEHMLGPVIAFFALPALVLVATKFGFFADIVSFLHIPFDVYTLERDLFLFVVSAWGIISLISIFITWTNFYLDVWVLTNKRVVDIEQKGLFSREVSTFRLEFIQDMTVEVHGIIPTLLGYGNIHIQTASSNREFYIIGIPKPRAFKQAIRKEYDRVIENKKP